MGILATNCSGFRREVWDELGGFDERFAGGGEDGAFCRAALASGYEIVLEPAMSLFHSHGLGPVNMVRQLWHWAHMGKPHGFSMELLQSYRKDLRTRE
jgi:GT2 family glycosyltransferase